MSVPEIDQQSDESARARLLIAAMEVFSRQGYSAATVREIVEHAGVTKPVLYYYFGSKEGLFVALMNWAAARMVDVLEAAVRQSGTAKERIFRACNELLALILENLGLVRLVHSTLFGMPESAPQFDFEIFHRAMHQSIKKLVEEGIAQGEFRSADPDDITIAILGVFDMAEGMAICHPDQEFGRAGLEKVLHIVFSGIDAK